MNKELCCVKMDN